MIIKIISIFITANCLSTFIFSQNPQQTRPEPYQVEESLEFIATDLREISKTVKSLNKEIVKAYGKLSSSMGLSLTENQQKILVSFEILNRAEQRLANLQKLRIDLIEKQTTINSQLNTVEINLRRESIERSISFEGTNDAQELRDKRRELLTSQKQDLSNLLTEIHSNLSQTNTELIQTTQLVDQIRFRLFPAIYQELPKLEYDIFRRQ